MEAEASEVWGSLRDQDLSERHRAYSSPRKGLCLRRQGLELARLKVFFKCMCEGKGSYKSILLPPPIPSLAPR